MKHEHNQGQHLSTEQMLDYMERLLTPAESSVVENHLATDCRSCHADLVWLQDSLNLMVSNIWLDPPARLRSSARRIFQDQQQQYANLSFGEWFKSLWVQPRSLMVGAAAMLILVIVGGLLLWSGPKNSTGVEIESFKGLVEVQAVGDDSWLLASSENYLQDGSSIRTGDDSTVVLSFPDESKVLIAPETELTVLRMIAQPESSSRVIILRQTSGTTHNIVQATSSSASRYEVQTPSATIIVQGTEFTIEVNDVGATRVMVEEGSVDVAAQGTTIAVDAGYATTVNTGEPPAKVVTAPTIPEQSQPTNSDDSEFEERETLASVEAPASATPTPTVKPTNLPAPSSTTPPTPNPTSPPGQLPATSTSTPSNPGPLPTDTEVPPPTEPASPTPKKTRKTPNPPGQTNTPQPPANGLVTTPENNSSH